MSTPEHQPTPKGEVEQLREDFPHLVVAGFDEPDRIPATVYHAFSGREEFDQDDFYDGSRSGVKNQLFGPGLYTGTFELASKYEQRLLQEDRNQLAAIEEIDITGARLLDTTQGKGSTKLPRSTVEDLREYTEAHLEVASYYSGQARSFMTAFHGWLEQYDSSGSDDQGQDNRPTINNLVNCMRQDATGFLRGYFVNRGVDGVVAHVQPSVDQQWQDIYVFWGDERVANADMQERRSKKRDSFKSFLGSVMLSGEIAPGQDTIKEQSIENPVLQLPAEIKKDEAVDMMQAIKKEGGVALDKDATHHLMGLLKAKRIDAFEVVRAVADCSPVIDRLMSADVGVWEGYRLHEHTQAVLNRFEDLSDINGGGLNDNQQATTAIMRLTLLLQDIGKPLAVSLEDKGSQHKYNRYIGESVMRDMPITEDAKDMVADLIAQDFIGETLQGGNVDDAVQGIKKLHDTHKKVMPSKNTVFQVLYTLHQVDASAYTNKGWYKDSDGKMKICKPGLDNKVFKMSSTTRRVKHKPSYQKKIKQIIDGLNA